MALTDIYIMVWTNDFSSWWINSRNEMNLTNEEHWVIDRLGITETDIIENSVIAAGFGSWYAEVINEFKAMMWKKITTSWYYFANIF